MQAESDGLRAHVLRKERTLMRGTWPTELSLLLRLAYCLFKRPTKERTLMRGKWPTELCASNVKRRANALAM
jgi:hypothetical protein